MVPEQNPEPGLVMEEIIGFSAGGVNSSAPISGLVSPSISVLIPLIEVAAAFKAVLLT